MKQSTLRIRSLLALTLALCSTACGQTTSVAEPPLPPSALVQPLAPEPAVPAANNSAAVGGYIVALRAFICEARARFNGLAEWASAGAFADPNGGRCAATPPPAPPIPPAQP